MPLLHSFHNTPRLAHASTPAFLGRATPQPAVNKPLSAKRSKLMMGSVISAATLTIIVGLGFANPAFAASKKNTNTAATTNSDPASIPKKKSLELEADRISQDKKTNSIHAEGNVQVFYQEQFLRADFLTLDKKTNQLWARGNVYFQDAGGRTIITEALEMSGDFKTGAVAALNGRLGQQASLTADSTVWEGSQRTMRNVSYTNCYLCGPIGDNRPLWRVRADKVVEDGDEKLMRFYNAWLEVFNIPILYSPYLSFPSPGVKRASGFLLPAITYHPTSGLTVRPAAFVVLNKYGDVMFNPYYSTNLGLIGSASLRQRFEYTDLNLAGIVLYDKPQADKGPQWQGYVYGGFLTSLNKEWEIAAQGTWTSHQNFFQHYPFLREPGSPGNDLVSYLRATGYISPGFVNYSLYYYQDNRINNYFDKILITPRVEFFGRGTRTSSGGQWRFDGDMRYYIEPLQGTNGLVSLDLGWQQPLYLPNGMVFNIDAGLRFDFISSHFYTDWRKLPGINIPGRDPNITNIGGTQNSIYRIYPEILATLSYPFIAYNKKNNLLLEPIVGAYFSFNQLINKNNNGSSNGGDMAKTILDTDSSPLEINVDNLFLRTRTLGSSYIEDWGRAAYGLKIANLLANKTEYRLFFGHGINFSRNQNPNVPNALAYNSTTTNLIFNASLNIGPFFNLSDTILLDDKDFNINRHAARMAVSYQAIDLSLSYFFYRDNTQVGGGRLQQLVPAANLRFGDNWSLQWSMIGDISSPIYTTRQVSLGLSYIDECFFFNLRASRNFAAAGNVSNTAGWTFLGTFKLLTF